MIKTFSAALRYIACNAEFMELAWISTSRRRAAPGAELQRNEAVVNLLLEKEADVDVKNCDGWTALHMAAESGHQTVVRLLLVRGADVDAKNYDGGLHCTWQPRADMRQ
jgi:ankyrin repeat protein